jgi:hypothetical protein
MITKLFQRSIALAWFGAFNILLFLAALILFQLDDRMLNGINIWIKPMKFALSVWIYSWTMAWLINYLPKSKGVKLAIWIIIITMIIEQFAIFSQAARGIGSHFNVLSGFYNSMVFQIMGIAITTNTIAVGVVTRWFFTKKVLLPASYLWGIRLGMAMFVLFSFEGFVMAALLQHTVGPHDAVQGVPFMNWSVSTGDLRIAHFIGIHALQLLPLAGYLFLKFKDHLPIFSPTQYTFGFAILHFAISLGTFIQAILGIPLFIL